MWEARFFGSVVAYAELLRRASGQSAPDPVKLIVPMIERFMATDRAFAKARRNPALGDELLLRLGKAGLSAPGDGDASAGG
jgi:hypothetical protein